MVRTPTRTARESEPYIITLGRRIGVAITTLFLSFLVFIAIRPVYAGMTGNNGSGIVGLWLLATVGLFAFIKHLWL